MKLNKFVFSNEQEIKNEISRIYDLELTYKEDNFSLFKLKRTINQDTEDIYFLYFDNFSSWFKYIKENYVLDKIIILWFAEIFWSDVDLKSWDVILPNTFLNKDDNDKIFLEYAIWENYDLNSFWLILSWILVSWDPEEENEIFADIKDTDSFDLLKEISSSDNLDKTVVIKWVLWSLEKKQIAKNIFNIFDLVV